MEKGHTLSVLIDVDTRDVIVNGKTMTRNEVQNLHDLLEKALNHLNATYTGEMPEVLQAEVDRLLNTGAKIPAIKLVRERMGLTLRDSKNLVDDRDWKLKTQNDGIPF